MNEKSAVVALDDRRRSVSSNGNGGGNEIGSRLRHLEIEFGKAQTDIAHIKQAMATKTDIEKLKVWILGGVLAAIAVAASIAAVVVKAFF